MPPTLFIPGHTIYIKCMIETLAHPPRRGVMLDDSWFEASLNHRSVSSRQQLQINRVSGRTCGGIEVGPLGELGPLGGPRGKRGGGGAGDVVVWRTWGRLWGRPAFCRLHHIVVGPQDPSVHVHAVRTPEGAPLHAIQANVILGNMVNMKCVTENIMLQHVMCK